MSKKNSTEVKEATNEDLQARIKELEAKNREGEEAVLERVCKAMGVGAAEVKAKEAAKPDERIIELFVHYPVNVNGTVYQGKVRVSYDTFRVISQSLGNRKDRILKELTGNNYVLQEIQGVGYAPKLVSTINDAGERIA